VETLHDKLSAMGANLLIETLTNILIGSSKRIKQNDSEATYAWNIKREEEHINFNRTALEVYNHIRGLYPFPTANIILGDTECKILEAYIGDKKSNFSPGTIVDITKDAIGITTRDNVVYITRLKPAGKKEMSASDYINGVDKSRFLHSIVK
jgi:methionyl-tRNA formyltransferase